MSSPHGPPQETTLSPAWSDCPGPRIPHAQLPLWQVKPLSHASDAQQDSLSAPQATHDEPLQIWPPEQPQSEQHDWPDSPPLHMPSPHTALVTQLPPEQL